MAAALSVILVLLFARLIGRYGPSLIVPRISSSLLHLAEYFFENSPRDGRS